MFSDGHSVYLVGGTYWSAPPFHFNTDKLYIFDPNTVVPEVQSFPCTSLPAYDSNQQYEQLVQPYIFRKKDHVYLLSHYDHSSLPKPIFSFQSFDLKEECFQTLPTPPLPLSLETKFFAGHLFVFDYIFLFTKQSIHSRFDYKNPKWRESAFSFDTRESEWKLLASLNTEFEQQHVPIPYEHIGDTGVSSIEFDGNVRILVVLHSGKPTAYRVSLDDGGASLHPISHRPLIDHTSSLCKLTQYRMNDKSHLLDLGDDRFCVIYSGKKTPLLVYIFKMNYDVENQNLVDSSKPPMESVTILCSRKFKHNIDDFRVHRVFSACLASVPASQGLLTSQVDHSKKPNEQPDEPPAEKMGGVAYVTDDDTDTYKEESD